MVKKGKKSGQTNKRQPEIRWQAIMRNIGLTRTELRELHEELVAKWQDLATDIHELVGISGRLPEGASNSCDVVDLAYREQEAEINSGLLAGELAELDEVKDALARMREGTYGVCEATAQPIGIIRLRARPWARFCIAHARKREEKARYRLPSSRRFIGW